MKRRLFLLALLLAGCQGPAEKLPVMPVPIDGPPLSYAEVVQRTKTQAATALEAFYVDQWADLSNLAGGLDQSAALLRKAMEVPADHQPTLGKDADELARLAGELREAAQAHDVERTNDALRRLNLKVRALRPARP